MYSLSVALAPFCAYAAIHITVISITEALEKSVEIGRYYGGYLHWKSHFDTDELQIEPEA